MHLMRKKGKVLKNNPDLRKVLPSILFFLTLCVYQQELNAQVLNVERVRAERGVEKKWEGELQFDVALDKNRETVLNLGNQANIAYFSKRNTYMLLNSIDFVSVDSDDVVSKGFFHLRGTFNSREKWSPEGFVQYQYNQNLGLQDRALAGAALRYTFLEGGTFTAHINTGLMFEREVWKTDEDPRTDKSLVKNTFNLVLRGDLTEQVNLLSIGYYQARPDKFFSPRVTTENSLQFSMTQSLVFTFNFTLAFDDDPVIEVPRLNFELKNGILILI